LRDFLEIANAHSAALVAGLEPRYLTLQAPEFALREEDLERAVDAKTRAVVVCTPSNPSGKMYSRNDLEALARVAQKHDLLVITDEIYEYIRYDGREHVSPASIPGLRDRTISIMGLSKTFSITGWRLGYAVGPAPLINAVTLVNDLYYVCAPTPLQLGAAAGFAAPKAYFDDLQSSYRRKRDILCEALSSARLTPIVPQGAYYVLADCTRFGPAREAAMTVLERARVASIPGTAFYRGAPGDRLLRFCFAKEDGVLEEACQRLRSI